MVVNDEVKVSSARSPIPRSPTLSLNRKCASTTHEIRNLECQKSPVVHQELENALMGLTRLHAAHLEHQVPKTLPMRFCYVNDENLKCTYSTVVPRFGFPKDVAALQRTQKKTLRQPDEDFGLL